MHRILVIACLLALTGCPTTSPDTLGTGTPTPAPDSLAKVGDQIDKSDQRVAAAVTVARENADKPEIVKAETGVALSYLPAPGIDSLTYARNRVARANPEEYKRAEEAGRKMLGTIDANWAKSIADAAKNKEALDNVNKEVARLKAENANLKAEVAQGKKDIVTYVCAALGGFLAIGAVGLLWFKQVLGAAACAIGAGSLLSFPSLVDAPWFLPSAAGVGAVCVVGVGLYLFRASKPCPKPAEAPIPDAAPPSQG